MPLIENSDFLLNSENIRTSVLPRNVIQESLYDKDGSQNRRRDETTQKEMSQRNHLKGLDQTVATLMKMFENLKQKSAECEKNKVLKAQSSLKSPQFTWVESQKLKPNIARNLALFGKPFDMKVPTQPPKMPVIKIWNPLSSKTRSSWKPMLGGSGWME